MVARTSVDPTIVEDLDRWYRDVHLPELVEVPGFNWGFRCRVVRSHPTYPVADETPGYLSVYEIDSHEVLQSQEFLSVRNWPKELREHADPQVAVYEIIAKGRSKE